MLLGFILSAAALSQVIVPQQDQDAGSLYWQVVTQPDPNNGYEDYLRAADLVNDAVFVVYRTWNPELSFSDVADILLTDGERQRMELYKRLDGKSLLEVRQEMVARYGTALQWVRQGNQKIVYDPRKSVESDTLFPELAAFRNLTYLAVASAHVKAASGDTTGATQDLLEELIRADRSTCGTIIQFIVASTNKALALAELDWLMPRLTTRDLRLIEERMQQLKPLRDLLRETLAREYDFVERELMRLATNEPDPEVLEDWTGAGDRVEQFLRQLRPDQIAELQRGLRAVVDRHRKRGLDLLSMPEALWYQRSLSPSLSYEDAREEEQPPIRSLQELISELELIFLDGGDGVISNQTVMLGGRIQTQLRLLLLHLRIEMFRLHYRRLPESLELVASQAEINDPFGDGRFVYEPREGGSYELYSKGTALTGPVKLTYRLPVASESDPLLP
jgi:hypothetical protein